MRRFTKEDSNIPIKLTQWLQLKGTAATEYDDYYSSDELNSYVWLRQYKDDNDVWYVLRDGDQEPFDVAHINDREVEKFKDIQLQKRKEKEERYKVKKDFEEMENFMNNISSNDGV